MRATGESYALVRTAKLKAFVSGKDMSFRTGTPPQCIDDAAEHELRLKHVSNADPSRRAQNHLIIIHGEEIDDMDFTEAEARGLLRRELFRSMVDQRLKTAGIDPRLLRKDQVLGQQVQLSASFGFFTRGAARSANIEAESPATDAILDDRYRSWRDDSVAFVRRKYGDRVIVIVEHLDELTPHLTAVVVPLVYKTAKRPGRGCRKRVSPTLSWRLCAFDLFNRKTLGELWSEYAEAMTPLGLHRPPRRAMIASSDVKQFYSAVADAGETAKRLERTLSFSLPHVESGIFGESAKTYRARAQEAFEKWRREIAELMRTLHFQAKAVEQLRNRETELRRALRESDERRKSAEQRMTVLQQENEALRASITDVVPARVLEKLGLELMIENARTFRVNLADGRVVRTSSKEFSITGPALSNKPSIGCGALELFMALFRTDAADAMRKCIVCFGEGAMGPIHAWVSRRFVEPAKPDVTRQLGATLSASEAPIECRSNEIEPTAQIDRGQDDLVR